MAGGRDHLVFQGLWFRCDDEIKFSPSPSSATSSIGQESTVSNGSSLLSPSSSDVTDDASSSSFSNPSRALYDLSEIMEQLPIKGLSKFYKGKSESFTSLSRVTRIEDLGKKSTPYTRNLKACKSIIKRNKRVVSSSYSSRRGRSFMQSKPK